MIDDMQLILVRHADAGAYTLPDEARALSPLGLAQAAQTAQAVMQNFCPDVFVCSPFLRAQETLAFFQKLAPHVPVVILDEMTPDADAIVALNRIAQLPQTKILVVCHMNIIANMAALLTGTYPEGFGLAEARRFTHPMLATGLATECQRWSTPTL